MLAALYAARTEVGTKFDEIREKEGLGAALRWRDSHLPEHGSELAQHDVMKSRENQRRFDRNHQRLLCR